VQAIGVDVRIESTDGVEEKTMQENRIITITEGSTAFSNNMEDVNRNEFICQICHDNFDSYEEYLVHTKLIHRCKPFVCKFCNKKFVLKIHLSGHMIEHNDIVSRLNSPVSPSKTQTSSKSKKNIEICNYKNYRQKIICIMCDKKFIYKKSFDKHILTHIY